MTLQSSLTPEMLDFIENTDIAIIPQTSEEYCRDATNLNPSDLEHILKLITLSPLQEEMLSNHYWLHHELFPKLITLAEKSRNPKTSCFFERTMPNLHPMSFQ
jgi:hypothetical protein